MTTKKTIETKNDKKDKPILPEQMIAMLSFIIFFSNYFDFW